MSLNEEEIKRIAYEALREAFADILRRDIEYYRRKYSEAVNKGDLSDAFQYKILEKLAERLLESLQHTDNY